MPKQTECNVIHNLKNFAVQKVRLDDRLVSEI